MRKDVHVAACLLLALTAFFAKAEDTIGELTTSARFNNANEILLSADEARDNGRMVEASTLYASARQLYRRLLADYPELQPRVVGFRIAYCSDQIDAISKKQKGLAAQPATPAGGRLPGTPASSYSGAVENLKRKAKALMQENKPEEAHGLLIEALKADPDDVSLRLLIAAAQCQTGKFEDAIYVLGELLVESPDLPAARIMLGSAYFAAGEMGKARGELARAIEFEPESTEARFNLAQLHLAAEPPDVESARKEYARYLELGGKKDDSLEGKLK